MVGWGCTVFVRDLVSQYLSEHCHLTCRAPSPMLLAASFATVTLGEHKTRSLAEISRVVVDNNTQHCVIAHNVCVLFSDRLECKISIVEAVFSFVERCIQVESIWTSRVRLGFQIEVSLKTAHEPSGFFKRCDRDG